MYNYNFPVDYQSILNRLERVDVVKYGKTRNFIFGKISYLSPYISRGVISLPFIKEYILNKFSKEDALPFIYELAWREYYQRTYFQIGDKVLEDIRHPQTDVLNYEVPEALVKHQTKILTIDEQIKTMYKTGYMHNHTRMYIASLACNIGKSHWLMPARWMYYNVLDGDIASNLLSWQWIAGTFSNKKYVANQDNLNYYTNSIQRMTFIDCTYEQLTQMNQPEVLRKTMVPELKLHIDRFKETYEKPLELNYDLPLLLYNSYNLDPLWHKDLKANRILLLEPSHFKKFPVSDRVLEFIISLRINIPGIQVLIDDFENIPQLNQFKTVRYKKHPSVAHYSGISEKQEWLFPEVHEKFYNTFSGFWNICQKFYTGEMSLNKNDSKKDKIIYQEK